VLNQILTLFNIKIEVISPTRINNEAIITVAETQIIEYLKEDNPSSTKEEIDKIKANIARLENEIKRSQSILSNQQFLTKAPPEKVKFEQTKYQQYQEQYKENIVIYQSMISKK
jgi:valyl-tRNA synthetase